jgi:protein O-mannosyl-transferase
MLAKAAKSRWLAAVLLPLLVFTAYSPAMRGTFLWDDDREMSNNPALTSEHALRDIWTIGATSTQFYPMTYSVLWAERRLWGINPLGYHLASLTLHSASAILVFAVLLQLGLPGAWFAAAVFAVHPVHAESAAWITEMKNVLSVFFYLLALFAYLRFEDTRRRGWYAAALAAFALALLSKTAVCALPIALLLLCWYSGRRIGWDELLNTAPFFALSAALGLVTIYVEKAPGAAGGAHGPMFQFSLVERVLIASRALWFYAGKLAWPAGLSFNYVRWNVNPHAPLQWLPVAGVLFVLAALWVLRGRIGRGPLAAVLYFMVTLAPASGLVPLFYSRYSFVADHFQYLGSLGLIVLAACGAAHFARKFVSPKVGAILALSTLALLWGASWNRAHAYRDIDSLWKDTLEKNPRSFLAYNNIGAALADQGHLDEAIANERLALGFMPGFAEAQNNLAGNLNRQGKFEEALALAQGAIRSQPDLPDAHLNLADSLAGLGKLNEAVIEYKEAARLRPGFVAAYVNLSNVLFRMGRPVDAILIDRAALTLNPEMPTIYGNLGFIYANQGDFETAKSNYLAALRLKPDWPEASCYLADVLAAQNKTAEAIEQYRRALKLRPNFPECSSHLAMALKRSGH